MKSLKTVFSLIRLPNLLMIAFSLYLIRFLILYPAYLYTHATFALSDLDFALMVLSIIFIAAGGYLINDIFDIETDQINQRVNHINRFIGTKAATYIYYIFSFIGFILGLILSLRINQLSLAVLFAIV